MVQRTLEQIYILRTIYVLQPLADLILVPVPGLH